MQPRLAVTTIRSSLLGRMDPRWKLAAAVLVGVAILCLQTVPAAALSLLLALLLLPLNRVPWRWFGARLGGVALFLSLFLVLLPLTLPGETVEVGPLSLSRRGLEVAGLVACKTLAFVALVLVVLATSPLDDLLHAAHALRVPGLLVQLLGLTHRYIHMLAEELAKLRIALRLRAYRNRATVHCYRTIGNVTGTLLVRSYERAERVGQAMRCRGFDGRFRTMRTFATRWSDLLSSCLVLIVGLLPLALDLWPRFAR